MAEVTAIPDPAHPKETSMVDIVADDERVTRQQWKWTILAGMASYIDAGSIVALGSGMTLFKSEFGLSTGLVGLLAAIGPNALGAGLGAFVGGRLGDKLGRKRIYKWDLLVYAFGVLLIVFSAPSSSVSPSAPTCPPRSPWSERSPRPSHAES
jgi:inositol transporter-like SP family MFS transporter